MSKVYGYCRISTKKQSIDRQVKNITGAYPDAIIIREEFTGTTTDRPKWNYLKKRLAAGDTVVFDEVSRMSRNSTDGFALYKELFNAGINLVFLKEPHINTDTYRKALDRRIDVSASTGKESTDRLIDNVVDALNRFLLDLVQEQIRLAFDQAEKEVDYLHQRTKEGIERARLEGKQIGGKAGVSLVTKKSIRAKEFILKRNKDFGGDLNDSETYTLAGISCKTFYKYKKELRLRDVHADTAGQ